MRISPYLLIRRNNRRPKLPRRRHNNPVRRVLVKFTRQIDGFDADFIIDGNKPKSRNFAERRQPFTEIGSQIQPAPEIKQSDFPRGYR